MSSANRFLQAHKMAVLIFILALSVRLLCISIAPPVPALFGYGADGGDYVNEAQNILQGHGFSRDHTPPFEPDAIRTPLYPLFLTGVHALFGSFAAVVYIEALLSSLIPLFAMAFVRFFVRKESLVVATGIFFAIEPHTVFYTTFFASEGVSIILLYAGLYSLMQWHHEEHSRDAGLAGWWLALSALARPIVAYVPLVLWPLFALVGYFRKDFRTQARRYGVFALVFVLVLSPWMLRNYHEFDSFGLGTVGWFNVYTRLAVTVVAIDEKTDFYTAYHQLLDQLSTRGYITHKPPVSEYEIQSPQFVPVLKAESLRILGEHKKALASFVVTGTLAVLTQDNTSVVIETLTGLQPKRPPFSPSLYISQHGLVAGVQALLPYLKGSYLVPYVGRAFWSVLFLLSLVGAGLLMRRGKWFEVLLCLGCIAYITLFTLNAGAQIDGRYRIQFLLCEVALAVAALEYMIVWIKNPNER